MSVARIRGTDTYVEVVTEGPNRALVAYVTQTGMHMEKVTHWLALDELIFDPEPPTNVVSTASGSAVFCAVPDPQRQAIEISRHERRRVIARLRQMIAELETEHGSDQVKRA